MTISGKWMNSSDEVIRIFIVRHGQTQWNIERKLQGHKNIPLNETGKKQAALLGRELEDYQFDFVISSDLTRCLQTLRQILGDKMDDEKLNFKKTENLRERFMGDVEGMYIKDAREKYGSKFKDRGETKGNMIGRLNKEWEQILEDSVKNGYKNVLLCAHGGVITNFFNYLYQEEHYKLGEGLGSDDLKVPYNTSLTIVDLKRDDLKDGTIRIWANTDHLGGVKNVADQQLV
ncbi:hypothetical protein FOA43_003419 [Brettanomyces nanus]|uniref:Phosphoglycerate mutase n=1 Tax=Eeniella nana TaxID=13502 RepID=A0A875S534_EENNA|nr:uncharacterized protein FOA43_003419 [Brettanomyces nanus]QPG76033.1 hypothetical protein FOA43_003419 [Brettanomyces nanus]